MEDISPNKKKLLKEVAPYLDFMKDVYKQLIEGLLKDGKTLEEAEDSAALVTVLGGLQCARNGDAVEENVDDLWFLADVFHISMSIEKLLDYGYIRGRILQGDKDDYGWPRLQVDGMGKRIGKD